MGRRAPRLTRSSIADRISRLDWAALEADLDREGFARTPPLLAPAECAEVGRLWSESARFRSHVDMERHGYGAGDYRYFRRPLPKLVQGLRVHLYRRLAPVANRWSSALGRDVRYPPSLRAFLQVCRRAGQARPTPLLLRYEKNGYNRLHRDLYGTVAFPLQAALFLSARGADYAGGEFLLVENRPRQQSIGHAIPAEQGEMVLFATSERPAPGRRGPMRAQMRHGVSRVSRGERLTLGIIFHDAR